MKSPTHWVPCPICHQPHMACEPQHEGLLIHCTNPGCPSSALAGFKTLGRAEEAFFRGLGAGAATTMMFTIMVGAAFALGFAGVLTP